MSTFNNIDMKPYVFNVEKHHKLKDNWQSICNKHDGYLPYGWNHEKLDTMVQIILSYQKQKPYHGGFVGEGTVLLR